MLTHLLFSKSKKLGRWKWAYNKSIQTSSILITTLHAYLLTRIIYCCRYIFARTRITLSNSKKLYKLSRLFSLTILCWSWSSVQMLIILSNSKYFLKISTLEDSPKTKLFPQRQRRGHIFKRSWTKRESWFHKSKILSSQTEKLRILKLLTFEAIPLLLTKSLNNNKKNSFPTGNIHMITLLSKAKCSEYAWSWLDLKSLKEIYF